MHHAPVAPAFFRLHVPTFPNGSERFVPLQNEIISIFLPEGNRLPSSSKPPKDPVTPLLCFKLVYNPNCYRHNHSRPPETNPTMLVAALDACLVW